MEEIGSNILVIDDDLSIGKLMSHYLPKNKILFYKSGEEALTYLKSSNGVSHGFIDLNLPGQLYQGKELIGKIRSLNNKIKLYIITAHYSSFPPSTCVDCGADGYIAKPLNKDIIKAVIENRTEEVMNEMLKAIPDELPKLNYTPAIEKFSRNDIISIDEEWCNKNFDTNIWQEAKDQLDTFRDSEYTPIDTEESEDFWNGK